MNPGVAVLVLTCDKYRRVAEVTVELIEKLWPDHPHIYICGLSDPLAEEPIIPFTSDSRDWMGIALEAATYLSAEGYHYAYLILDDHPPVSKCNSEYLNVELPLLARQLEAAVVSLVGWDQVRQSKGSKMGSDCYHWLKNDPDYRWVFNLHPGCWDLQAVSAILRRMISSENPDRSARAFESLGTFAEDEVIKRYARASYRVCGDRYAIADKWFNSARMRQFVLQFIHITRFLSGIFGGQRVLQRVDQKLKIYTDFLNGPYPMFWSGLMQKGTIHQNAVKFLRLSGLEEYADRVDKLQL